MQFRTHRAALAAIQDMRDDHLTEDSYHLASNGDQIVALVADGAPQRVKTTEKMRPMLDTYGPETTPGRYASLLARDVIARQTTESPTITLKDAVIAANDSLRAGLESIYGELSAQAVLAHQPELSFLRDDPRLLRLILPVCCVTAARVDLRAGRLEYAHGGDTGLFLFHRDGRVTRATRDQMLQHDSAAVRMALALQHKSGAPDLVSVIRHEKVAEVNVGNGIYHNYEDEHGQADATVGVATINGLPSLAAYVETGSFPLDDLDAILLCSDGFYYPAPLEESEAEARARYRLMREEIEAGGLTGYIAALRAAEQSDPGFTKYPRLGQFDDATAVYITFH
jgi:serine/threonine protein phosphatase PrpC